MAGPSFSRLGSNFQRTVLVPASCICFVPRETGPDGEASRSLLLQVRADVFFSFTEFPDPPSLFFSSGRISRLVPQSFLPSFLPSCLSVLCPMFFSRSHRALQSSDLVCSTVPLHQRRRHCVCHSPAFVAISLYSTNSLSLASAATMHDDNDRKDGDAGPSAGRSPSPMSGQQNA